MLRDPKNVVVTGPLDGIRHRLCLVGSSLQNLDVPRLWNRDRTNMGAYELRCSRQLAEADVDAGSSAGVFKSAKGRSKTLDVYYKEVVLFLCILFSADHLIK